MRNPINSKGLSLVEVIIAVGILGAMSLGVATMMTNMNTEIAAATARVNVNALSQDARMVLAAPGNCTNTFRGIHFEPAQLNSSGVYGFASGITIPTIGSLEPDKRNDLYGVNVRSVYLTSFTGSGTNYSANLMLEADSVTNTRAMKPVVLAKIAMTLSAGTTVTGCSVLGSGAMDVPPACPSPSYGPGFTAQDYVPGTEGASCTPQYMMVQIPKDTPPRRVQTNSCVCTVRVVNGEMCYGCTVPPPPPQPDRSCFTGETRITMADGSLRPIAEVRAGDEVRGLNGQVNRVLKVEVVGRGERALFAIDEGKPFFTAEHPFLTPDGWRSISPELTWEESPSLPIAGDLKVGDLVLHDSHWEKITALPSRQLPTSETVYNLILDGDRTYEANGYRVHNKQ